MIFMLVFISCWGQIYGTHSCHFLFISGLSSCQLVLIYKSTTKNIAGSVSEIHSVQLSVGINYKCSIEYADTVSVLYNYK